MAFGSTHTPQLRCPTDLIMIQTAGGSNCGSTGNGSNGNGDVRKVQLTQFSCPSCETTCGSQAELEEHAIASGHPQVGRS